MSFPIKYSIISIYRMSTPYKPKKQRSKSAQNKTRRLLVHQTTPDAAASILGSQQFLPGKEGGIFFARTAPETDKKARTKGTYLMADVYLGHTEHVSHNELKTKKSSSDSLILTEHESGKEYFVESSTRIKNIRYLDGIPPRGFDVIKFRKRMPLIYATTARKAADIIRDQRIDHENRSDIAGYGIYLWENIPDARNYSQSGNETFLAADVYFINVYQSLSHPFPTKKEYNEYDTFRGSFQNTRYYMVKHNAQIERLHFIGGIRPKENK